MDAMGMYCEYIRLEPNSRPCFFFLGGGVDRHHFMGQIFQNMGHLSSVSTPHKFSIDHQR